MKSYAAAIAIAGFASSVAAHGFISSPTPRLPGDGLKAACGDQVYNTQNSDKYGNVQGSLQNFNGDPNLTTDAQRRDAMKKPPGEFLPQAVRGKVDYVVADLYRTRAP